MALNQIDFTLLHLPKRDIMFPASAFICIMKELHDEVPEEGRERNNLDDQ